MPPSFKIWNIVIRFTVLPFLHAFHFAILTKLYLHTSIAKSTMEWILKWIIYRLYNRFTFHPRAGYFIFSLSTLFKDTIEKWPKCNLHWYMVNYGKISLLNIVNKTLESLIVGKCHLLAADVICLWRNSWISGQVFRPINQFVLWRIKIIIRGTTTIIITGFESHTFKRDVEPRSTFPK